MAVRLRVRLEREGRSVETVALVNSGYEARGPEILVPAHIARELGTYPQLPPGSEVMEYVLADGSRSKMIRVKGAVRVSLVAEDRVEGPVTADLVIAEGAEEALISDKLADELGIAIIAVGEGLWCFRDELGRRVRRSQA